MIDTKNFKALLESLEFQSKSHIYTKTLNGTPLSVDFKKEEIIYPESKGLVINQRQTCNFSSNENFVVFECVHRLLDKGYKPEHIELEPKWKVGHGASGGRADILIRDNFKKPLLIIECKTAGKEFNKAWSKTQQDGDQLFSYAQQISETQFLCLYASDFEQNTSVYTSYIIAHKDNDDYLKDNPLKNSFREAADVKQRFLVWRDTYQSTYSTKGIFEESIKPYIIGKTKYTLSDLSYISAVDQQKKFHEFATILRQHNVAGRENAFDKLVNLFLCKLVDEIENPEDLKFYWKGMAYDTHYDLVDRIQQLYQSGMDKFLDEDITYINKNDVMGALRFIKQDPDATQRAVWNLFLQQKFFTNSDFSFIDVHNENLFYQNSEILLKIIQMWQDVRLTNPDGHNQFLGDMFEGFLDQGVRQSEGQFFTPMPICRFINMSLPLSTIVKANETPPNAIDYACGAGHFLTELASQLEPIVKANNPKLPIDNYHSSILGIEKEYRLSKVAKVSAFMYGQQEINICYGDGLVQEHKGFPEIREGNFDILIANPPYSVKGFLETLPDADRSKYDIEGTIKDAEAASGIETFFIERAKQLLRPNGVAAIILPSSILSNGDQNYIAAREIILKYFEIISIVEFASGTFGKTGTNTVTLFLRRKNSLPNSADHFAERVDAWFNNAKSGSAKDSEYKDRYLLEEYCDHIGVLISDYENMLADKGDSWGESEHFDNYKIGFTKSNSKSFRKWVMEKERDKVYYFLLSNEQANSVLVVRSPTTNKALKEFLGYSWSSSKGKEGIKLIENENGQHMTCLYEDPVKNTTPRNFNRENISKINHHIAANFDGNLRDIPESLSEYCSTLNLTDLIDFSSPDFEKVISLAISKTIPLNYNCPSDILGNVCDVRIGGTPSRSIASYFDGKNPWVSIGDMDGKILLKTKEGISDTGVAKSNVKLIPKGTTLFSFKLSIGKTAIAGVDLYTNEAIAGIIPKSKKVSNDYIFHIFNSGFVVPDKDGLNAFGKSLNSRILREKVRIPIPNKNVQKEIVKECEKIENSTSALIDEGIAVADLDSEIKQRKYQIFADLLLDDEGGK